MRGRTPVAVVCPETCAQSFQPTLDAAAAYGCAVSLSPVLLGLHWGVEFNRAQDTYAAKARRLRAEYEACLRGDGCPVAYEEAKEACAKADADLELARPFRIAGATQELVASRVLPLVASRVLPKAAALQRLQRRRLSAFRSAGFRRRSASPAMSGDTQADEDEATGGAESLEAKMASWEATEEEARATTLGGNLPLVGLPGLPGRMTRTDQPTKLDGFDVGMNLSGLILFPLAIALVTVPFWIGNIDVGDVGPPPSS